MSSYVTCALHIIRTTDTDVIACTVESTGQEMVLPKAYTAWVHEPKSGGFETAVIALHDAERHVPLVSVVREWREFNQPKVQAIQTTSQTSRKERGMLIPYPPESGSFKTVPAGSYPAICYRVIDLGTQESVFNDERKELRKVMLSFEIRDVECITDDGKPLTISQRYTLSMHEKSTLRKHLEAWRAKPFEKADFRKFNIRTMLGEACMVSVIHSTNNDKVFANISSISKLPKGLEAGALQSEQVYLSLTPDEFDRGVFDGLSDSIKSTIMKSPEYRRLSSNGNGSADSGYVPKKSASGERPSDWQAPLEVNDEIPF
jgi:hypothetical protein